MGLEKEIQDEIEKFRDDLPCKKQKFCLPLYIITENFSESKTPVKKVRTFIRKGINLHKTLTDAGKKKMVDSLYKIINEYMRGVLYPNEDKINIECETYDCPVYSAIREMEHGKEFSEFITAQIAAIDTFKWKRSQEVGYDIGKNEAGMLWTKERINFNGGEKTRADIFKQYYKNFIKDKIEEFLKNHNKLQERFPLIDIEKKAASFLFGKV